MQVFANNVVPLHRIDNKEETIKHVVVLTGAGISAEGGLSTFRDNDGLWTR